ncbi:MAG: hypothetical protein AB1498_03090 [bacterium]
MKKNILFLMLLLFCINLKIFAEEKPRVAFIILEEDINEEPTTITETKLKSLFNSKGFNIVESVFKEILPDEDLLDDEEKVKSLVKNLSAEIVVIGKVSVTEEESESYGLKSYLANISVTAFKTDNAEILGSFKNQATVYNEDAGAGSSDALEKVSSEFAGEFVNQVLEKWTSKVSK